MTDRPTDAYDRKVIEAAAACGVTLDLPTLRRVRSHLKVQPEQRPKLRDLQKSEPKRKGVADRVDPRDDPNAERPF